MRPISALRFARKSSFLEVLGAVLLACRQPQRQLVFLSLYKALPLMVCWLRKIRSLNMMCKERVRVREVSERSRRPGTRILLLSMPPLVKISIYRLTLILRRQPLRAQRL